ncbi:MAG: rhomboid family intramembrane serine protease [Candidatus Thermoplasmatota archaeon]|nr:rhomboid family intramembrane serine protease [Candidatus Thermoplasmatota archaeon]MDD5778135.1 rhomboid family intramembrane serine protease [Candidatus Thermoplasmatota archaeon]
MPWSLLAVAVILGGLAYALYKKMLLSQMIIIINFAVFFLMLAAAQSFSMSASPLFPDLAFRPRYLTEGEQIYTLFTSLFVHADIWHILMNMFIFLLIGVPFEQRVGTPRFAAIYFLAGVGGTLTFSLFNWNSGVMLVGASGAIFGVFGAFAALYPRDQVVMPIPFPIMLFIRMPVLVAALLFAGLETLYTVGQVSDGVAHLAHIGGLVSGVALAAALRKIAPRTISASAPSEGLASLARTDAQRQFLERVREADIPEVREAWMTRFLEEVECPRCGGPLISSRGIRCQRCGARFS